MTTKNYLLRICFKFQAGKSKFKLNEKILESLSKALLYKLISFDMFLDFIFHHIQHHKHSNVKICLLEWIANKYPQQSQSNEYNFLLMAKNLALMIQLILIRGMIIRKKAVSVKTIEL